jgi:hypothetical protein
MAHEMVSNKLLQRIEIEGKIPAIKRLSRKRQSPKNNQDAEKNKGERDMFLDRLFPPAHGYSRSQ